MLGRKEFSQIILRFISGTAGQEERIFVNKYFNWLARHKGGVVDPGLGLKEKMKEAVWMDTGLASSKQAKAIPLFNWRAAAAAVMGGSILLFLARQLFLTKPGNFDEIRSAKGQFLKVNLPDGSNVWLNAASKLRIEKNFIFRRELELEGEAYFEVAKDRAHPFYVHTGGLTTRVLGTHFNINAYHPVLKVEVTLLEGSVLLMAKTKLRLAPGEKAVYQPPASTASMPGSLRPQRSALTSAIHKQNTSAADKLLKKTKVDAPQSIFWKDGTLVFEEEQLKDVVETLSRRYNAHVKVSEALGHRTLQLTVENTTIERTLLKICDLLNRKAGEQGGERIQFKKQGNTYTIM